MSCVSNSVFYHAGDPCIHWLQCCEKTQVLEVLTVSPERRLSVIVQFARTTSSSICCYKEKHVCPRTPLQTKFLRHDMEAVAERRVRQTSRGNAAWNPRRVDLLSLRLGSTFQCPSKTRKRHVVTDPTRTSDVETKSALCCSACSLFLPKATRRTNLTPGNPKTLKLDAETCKKPFKP